MTETLHIGDAFIERFARCRIDAGNLRLEKQPHLIGDIVSSALIQLKGLLDGREVRVDLPPEPLHNVRPRGICGPAGDPRYVTTRRSCDASDSELPTELPLSPSAMQR